MKETAKSWQEERVRYEAKYELREEDLVSWTDAVDGTIKTGIIQRIDPVYATIDVDEANTEIQLIIANTLSQESMQDLAGNEPMYWEAYINCRDGRTYGIKVDDLKKEII